MLTTIMILPDGTEISSGQQQVQAIKSLKLTQRVNSGTELTLGSVCAAMAEVSLIAPEGSLSIHQGDELQLFRKDAAGNLYPLGVFIAEKPERSGPDSLKLTAYDRVSLLDKDLTQWLAGLQQWPYRLEVFAGMVCEACGVTLADTQLPNGAYSVQKFSAENITGRQLLQWVGQIAGRFCRANATGALEFGWYAPNPSGTVGAAEGMGAFTFYGGSLSYSDYQTEPVEKVQIKQTQTDIGTLWPEDLQDTVNTYALTGNYLLTASGADDLKPIAQTLYEQLAAVTYTPCKLRIPANFTICAGDIITVTDRNGVAITVYVMEKVQSGQSDTLSCTGSRRRDSTWAVNELSVQALSGKVTQLQLDVDGVKVENRDAAGKYAKLALELGGIQAAVGSQQENIQGVLQSMTSLQQDAQSLALSVQSVRQEGVGKVQTQTGYRFDDKGLSICRSDSNMENLLDDTGMYVKRSGEVVLQANDEGVEAVDVTVRNYLIVGSHARFEDYADGTDDSRTACFWI